MYKQIGAGGIWRLYIKGCVNSDQHLCLTPGVQTTDTCAHAMHSTPTTSVHTYAVMHEYHEYQPFCLCHDSSDYALKLVTYSKQQFEEFPQLPWCATYVCSLN